MEGRALSAAPPRGSCCMGNILPYRGRRITQIDYLWCCLALLAGSELRRIHLLKLSEKPRIGPRGGPARGQKGPFGPFDRPYSAQIHALSVAPTPFRTVSLRLSEKGCE